MALFLKTKMKDHEIIIKGPLVYATQEINQRALFLNTKITLKF